MSFTQLIEEFAGSVAGYPARSFTNENHPDSARLNAGSVAGSKTRSQPPQNALLDSGLGWALVFTDALIRRLEGSDSRVIVSAWHSRYTTGLFLEDAEQNKALRVAYNVQAGCGRVFWGFCDDFEYPSREPNLSTTNTLDFDFEEMPAALETVYQFLTKSKSNA